MASRVGGYTIADVTDWYLSGAHPSGDDDKRGPESAGGVAPERLYVEAVLAAHLDGLRAEAIERYVRRRAERTERVLLLTAGPGGQQLRGVEAGVPADGDEGGLQGETGDGVLRAQRLMQGQLACDRLVVHAQKADGEEDTGLLELMPAVIVLAEGSEAGQLAAYRAVKRYHRWLADRVVRLFIVGAADEQDGAATGRRLSQLVQRFLGLNLAYVGCALAAPPVREFLREQAAEAGNGDPMAGWAAALQELVDAIGQPPEDETEPDAVLVERECEIEFAIPIEAPLASMERLEAFVAEHGTTLAGEGRRCERVGETTDGEAVVYRTISSSGERGALVVATGPAVGAIELALARTAGVSGLSEIVWVGHGPGEVHTLAAKWLGVPIRAIGLRHVCVDGRLGVVCHRLSSGD